LLKEDPEDIAFNVYRMDIGKGDYMKVNREPITTSTNYIDTEGGARYGIQI
jgi:hypothetical protein